MFALGQLRLSVLWAMLWRYTAFAVLLQRFWLLMCANCGHYWYGFPASARKIEFRLRQLPFSFDLVAMASVCRLPLVTAS